MNETIKAVILGIVQGLSEFLPISSSGHLVLFQELLGFKGEGLELEVFVHFGTLLAVLIVFRKDVWQMIRWLPGVPQLISKGLKIQSEEDRHKAMSCFILIGSLPAAVLGLAFKDQVEFLFSNLLLVLFMLLVTAVILWTGRYTEEKSSFLTWQQALMIGFAQALAIIPGISRSGSTIIIALWLGINRGLSAKFSFLLSIPIILGATMLQVKDLLAMPPTPDKIQYLSFATIAAMISGYFAIIWLLDVVRKQKLEWFALYCATVSIAGILVIIFR